MGNQSTLTSILTLSMPEPDIAVLTLDDPINDQVTAEIRKEIQVQDIRAITLP